MCHIIKKSITGGASVYMWHEGSHRSDVYWFRAKLEWGKGEQDYDPFKGGGFIQIFVMRVFNLTFQGGNQLYIEILTLRTIVCFGKV